ncbi:MAG: DUF3592 domain-containing protein [Planctomycetes bacterium]|nr:DUF3592 domain-containing protein [Planctomycetota bacterium]
MNRPLSHRKSALACFAAATVFLIGGAIPATFAFPMFLRADCARHWPSAPGRIESSHVESTPGSPRGTVLWECHVAYVYEVNGVAHRGDNRTAADIPGRQGRAQADATRYAPGRAVSVRFNPENPADAVLEPGPDAIAWSLAIVATFGLSLAGLWFAEGLIRCRSPLDPHRRE